MKQKRKRLTALAMALSMCLSLLCSTAWASELAENGEVPVEAALEEETDEREAVQEEAAAEEDEPVLEEEAAEPEEADSVSEEAEATPDQEDASEAEAKQTPSTGADAEGIMGEPASADAFAAGLLTTSSDDTATVQVNLTYRQTNARSMLALVNEFRTGDDAWYWNSDDTTKTICSGLSELSYDYNLEKVAMQRAAEIAVSYGHTRANGESCWTAYSDFSYGYYSAGENIAAGYTTVQSMFNGWAEENQPYSGQGHRRNMLNANYNAIGIACVYYNGYYYWVQEFAKARSTAGFSAVTTANDALTTVPVEIALSNTTTTLTPSPASLSVQCGESVSLPSIALSIRMTSSWPGRACAVTADVDWTVENGDIAAISGGKVSGSKAGSTTLTAAAVNGTADVALEVTPAPVALSTCTVTLSGSSFSYTGNDIKPAVAVMDGATALTEGTDYTVAYSDNLNIGTASVTLTGKGSYTGTVKKTFQIVLGTPTISSLSNGETGVAVKWGKVTGAEKYRVFRKRPSESEWVKVKDTTGTSCTDTTVESVTYQYCVKAYKGSDYSNKSAIATIKYLTQPVLSGQNTSLGIKLTWDKVSGATSYGVFRCASGESTWTKLGTTTTLTYKDTTAEEGTFYQYKIKAYSGSYYSSYSAVFAQVRLAQPVISSVSNSAAGAVTVKWAANPIVGGYQIDYSTSSSFSSYTRVKVAGSSNTSAVINGLTKGTKYYVRLRTYKTIDGKASYSYWSSVKTLTLTK